MSGFGLDFIFIYMKINVSKYVPVYVLSMRIELNGSSWLAYAGDVRHVRYDGAKCRRILDIPLTPRLYPYTFTDEGKIQSQPFKCLPTL